MLRNKWKIAKASIKKQDDEYTERIEHSRIELEEASAWRAELVHYLGESLIGINVKEKIRIWAFEKANHAVNNHIPLDQSLKTISIYIIERLFGILFLKN
jgi:hypothetical protein